VVDSKPEDDVVSEAEVASVIEVKVEPESPQLTTRSGRLVKKHRNE